MSRWTGQDHTDTVHAAVDAWRDNCLVNDGSLFGYDSLWTLDNIRKLKELYLNIPERKDRPQSFINRLDVALKGAAKEQFRLMAEVFWLAFVLPVARTKKPSRKREQINQIWRLSGSELPHSPYLSDQALMGFADPGFAYSAHFHRNARFILEVLEQWKSLPDDKQKKLLNPDAPWDFIDWLDNGKQKTWYPMRYALLYLVFPDNLERIISHTERKQLFSSLGHLLPPEFQPNNVDPANSGFERAIYELRKILAKQSNRAEFDFYLPNVLKRWSSRGRNKAYLEITKGLSEILTKHNLDLCQGDNRKRTLDKCHPTNTKTGYWDNPEVATENPLRWIVHLEISDDKLAALVPDLPGSRNITYSEDTQQEIGAITSTIIPAIKVADEKFVFFENWEWLLLLTFIPPLSSSTTDKIFELDEATGSLLFDGQEQPYDVAALITLQADDSLFMANELHRVIKYSEATKALTELIKVSPETLAQ